jgi:hypothetical protein
MTRNPQTALKAALTCLALAGALSACEDGGTSPPTGPALRILAGAGVTDTISTAPLQGLVVQVLDEDGQPDVGVEVRFEVPSDAGTPFVPPRIQVAAVGAPTFGAVAGATTDANGRATVRVRLGERAGPAGIVISVPLYSLVDTAEYTVLPGNAVSVMLSPKDTAVLPGTDFTYRGSTRDRAGNARLDPATWEVSGSAVSVDQSGRVTALSTGFAVVRVRATVGGVESVDSGNVTVVPQARIAWTTDQLSLAVSDLTGENMTTLVSSQGLAPAWHPDGSRMVYVREGGLAIVDLQGNVTVLNTPGVSDATWPEYSADGQWIYFHGEQDFARKVYRIRPSGTDMQLIGPSEGSGEMPTLSPDGRRVAWVNASRQLVVHDLATGTESVVPGTGGVYAPRWSPDGAWIAYTGYPGPLTLVRPDRSDLRRVGQHELSPGISWSPDSKWIIGLGTFRNVLVDVTTGRSGLLSWGGRYPAWRP